MTKSKKYIYLSLIGASLVYIFYSSVSFGNKDTLTIFNEAEDLFEAGNHREALEKYEQLISIDPSFVRGYRGITRCYNSFGDPQGALLYMEFLFLEYPDKGEVSYGLGYSLYFLQKFFEALKYFKKAIELDRAISAAWNNCAVIYHFILKDYRKARYYYEEAIKISKRNGDDWVLKIANENIANLPRPLELRPLTDKISLEDYINRFIDYAENDKDKELQQLVLGQMKNSEKAMGWFLNKAIRSYVDGHHQVEENLILLAELLEEEYRISFNSFDLFSLLYRYKKLSENEKVKIITGEKLLENGLTKEHIGRYIEARNNYQEALKHFSDIHDKSRQGLALIYLGGIYRKLRNYSLAKEFYAKGFYFFIETGEKEKEASALSSLGITCFMLGQNAEAIDYLNRSLEIYHLLQNTEAILSVQHNLDQIMNKGQPYLE